MKLNWSSIELIKNKESRIKAASGVYVIKEVERVMGLPITQEIIYVGKSVNLQRRFKEHCGMRTEHNMGLLHSRWKKELEYWFAYVKENEISIIETKLIQQLKPLTNIVKYKGRKG